MQHKHKNKDSPRPAPRGKRFYGALILLAIGAAMLMAAACNRQMLSGGQASGNMQDRFWASVRPPSGETDRLLRNARYLKMVGRTQLALKDLEEAYQRDPGNLQVVDALAQCYEELGAWARAEELYREALARDKGNQALANNLCFSYYQAGNWAKAEACFREALKRNPKNAAARNNLGLLMAGQGREAEALALWRETEGDIKASERLNLALAALGKAPLAVAQAAKPAAAAPKAATPPETKAAVPSPPAAQPQVAVTPAAPAKAEAAPVKAAVPAAKPEAAPVTAAAAAVSPAAPASRPEVESKAAPVAAAVRPEPAKPVELAAATPPQEAKAPAAVAPAAAAPQASTPAKQVLAAKSEEPPVPVPVKQSAPAPTPEAVAPAPAAPPAAKPTEVKPPVKPQKKAVASAPAPAPVKEAPLPILTSQELINTRLEILNGNGIKGTAAQSRTWLNLEGFTVASVGNHRDYGVKETVVSYRPGAEKVARVLAGKFYQTKELKLNAKLPQGIEVRVVLGHDQKPRQAKIAQVIAALEAKAIPMGDVAAASQPAPPMAQAAAPVEAPAAKTAVASSQSPQLTAEELSKTRIELRNGNGVQDQARQSRSLLSLEGFNVVGIKNHVDFGLDQTLIAFKPGAEKVAQALAARFFHSARLEEAAKLPEGVDVKVVLGRDFQAKGDMLAKLAD